MNPSSNYKNMSGDKAAQMVQAWGIAFHARKLRSKYPVFFNTYKHLVNDKGIRFPEATKDETPVILPDGKNKEKKSGGERLRHSINTKKK